MMFLKSCHQHMICPLESASDMSACLGEGKGEDRGMVSYSKTAVERAMKVQEVILGAIAKKQTWWQDVEGLQMSGRQLRRLRAR